MAQSQVTFVQKLTINALFSADATTDQVHEFLVGTGYMFTEGGTLNGFRGIVHEEGRGTSSPSRKFLERDGVIVKVNGKFSQVMTRQAFDKVYA